MIINGFALTTEEKLRILGIIRVNGITKIGIIKRSVIFCIVEYRYINLLTYTHGGDPHVLLVNCLQKLNANCKKKRLDEYKYVINNLRVALAVGKANLPRIGNEQVANHEVCMFAQTKQT